MLELTFIRFPIYLSRVIIRNLEYSILAMAGWRLIIQVLKRYFAFVFWNKIYLKCVYFICNYRNCTYKAEF